MSEERPPIQGCGVVVARLGTALYRVRMSNGYEVFAPLDRSVEATLDDLGNDEAVVVEFSPYNMRQARIMERGA